MGSLSRYQAYSVTKYNIPVLNRPPGSPELASCDFHTISNLKYALKGKINSLKM